MDFCYVSDDADEGSYHEVHESECPRLSGRGNRTYLGPFPSCHPAVAKAKTIYPNSDGRAYFSPTCHQS